LCVVQQRETCRQRIKRLLVGQHKKVKDLDGIGGAVDCSQTWLDH